MAVVCAMVLCNFSLGTMCCWGTLISRMGSRGVEGDKFDVGLRPGSPERSHGYYSYAIAYTQKGRARGGRGAERRHNHDA